MTELSLIGSRLDRIESAVEQVLRLSEQSVSILPSFLRSSPSFLPFFLVSSQSFLASFLHRHLSFLPSLTSFLPSFLPSFTTFLPSVLPSFLHHLPSCLHQVIAATSNNLPPSPPKARRSRSRASISVQKLEIPFAKIGCGWTEAERLDLNPNNLNNPEGGGGSGSMPGGQSEVYEARYQNKRVAVKCQLTNNLAPVDIPGIVTTFKREVGLMYELRGPKIAQIVGCVTTQPGRLMLVMELAELGSLRSVLDRKVVRVRARGGMYALDKKILGFLLDIAYGMLDIHGHGMLHRDLKSTNVLVFKDGSAKISDFGRSKYASGAATSLASAATTCNNVGTYAWASPEQLQYNECTEKSDVYSFAIIVWEVLTGNIPWNGLHEAQIASSVLGTPSTPAKRPPIPANLKTGTRQRRLIALMVEAWDASPEMRPDFNQIVQRLEVICR
jgi:hypothetical protein